MKNIIFLFCLLFGNIIIASSQSNGYDLIIENVDVFNSRTKQVEKSKTIFIKNDIIVDIVDFTIPLNEGNVIRGDGKLMVPGFIDTHVHLSQIFGDGNEIAVDMISNSDMYKQALKDQYLKYGTTTILDLGQPENWLPVSTSWQRNSSIEYPNLYNAGAALKSDQYSTPNLNHAEIFNEQHAGEKLGKYAELGIRHIKLYSWLKRRDIISVLKQAEKKSLIPFAHIDRGEVEINEGIDLGIRNFEHFFTVINAVLNTEEHSRNLNKKYNLVASSSIDEWTAKRILYFDYIASNPELSQKLESLLDKLANSGSTISTTIHALASVADETNFFSTFQTFPLRNKSYLPAYTQLKKDDLKSGVTTMMNFVKKAHDKGVKLRIGTDCRYGGRVLINEVMLLAESGISIPDILQIATYNGAVAMGIADKYGIIEKGKIADLIIFDENPMSDDCNFESKKTIIKGGKLIEFKEIITNDFVEKVLSNGIDNALQWYNEVKESDKYYSAYKSQVIEVGYELIKYRKICEAIEVFRFCQLEFQDYKESYNWIHKEHLNQETFLIANEGNPVLAIELLKYNAELFPNSWSIYSSLGELYLGIGDLISAKEYFLKSLSLNPSNHRVKSMLRNL